MSELMLFFIASYLFGSFPTAFLLIRLTARKDIRGEGSGNVGTLNALRVSKKKWVGAVVLILDLAKGALPVWYAVQLGENNSILMLVIVGGVVLGHVYPVWLKFRGGRGLAVAAGALLMIDPILVAIWLVIWGVFYLMLKNHIIASMIAIIGLPLIVFFARGIYFPEEYLLFLLPVMMLILQRHLERLPDIVEETRVKIKDGEIE